jgi:hypothetical protein
MVVIELLKEFAMKCFNLVCLSSAFLMSQLAWSATMFNDCSGSIYDSKSDVIRQMHVEFAIGSVEDGQRESAFVSISDKAYGIAECPSSKSGNVACKVDLQASDDSLPASLSFVRSNGEISFAKKSGYRGQLKCNLWRSPLTVERFSWTHIPKAPGDKIGFTVQVKQDNVADIDACWGYVGGIAEGRKVAGVRFDTCSIVPYENGSKLIHFSDVASKDFVPGVEYFIESFSLRNEGDSEGSALRGWAFGSFNGAR